jgi:hypothetical protein
MAEQLSTIRMTVTGGKGEYPLSDCSYSLFRNTDSTGKPVQFARAGAIEFTKLSSEDLTFLQWAASPSQSKDGSITYYESNTKSMRKIEFKGGVVTSYSESASGSGGSNMIERVSIYVKSLTCSGSTVNNEEKK